MFKLNEYLQGSMTSPWAVGGIGEHWKHKRRTLKCFSRIAPTLMAESLTMSGACEFRSTLLADKSPAATARYRALITETGTTF